MAGMFTTSIPVRLLFMGKVMEVESMALYNYKVDYVGRHQHIFYTRKSILVYSENPVNCYLRNYTFYVVGRISKLLCKNQLYDKVNENNQIFKVTGSKSS